MKPTILLNNGVELPRIGLGVYRAPKGDVARNAVLSAIAAGYRHIDTARIYGNEADVGAAIRECGLPRREIFLTTKLWNDNQGYDEALYGFERSLDKLGFDYVDLYLIHWPVTGKRLDSWRALERIYREGRARAIGVSNYMPHHLEELLSVCEVVPAANQIELSPFLQQRDVMELCRKHGIAVVAYSPLTKGRRLDHPTVVDVANKLNRTPAQVLVRWGLEKGAASIPKSVSPRRIEENLRSMDFEIPPEEMARLDALHDGLVTGWDPREIL